MHDNIFDNIIDIIFEAIKIIVLGILSIAFLPLFLAAIIFVCCQKTLIYAGSKIYRHCEFINSEPKDESKYKLSWLKNHIPRAYYWLEPKYITLGNCEVDSESQRCLQGYNVHFLRRTDQVLYHLTF